MAIEVVQLTPVFAGRMTGIDVRRQQTPGEVAAVDAGMAEHAVLVLPDQDITDEQQLEFTRNFGPLQDGANTTERRHELRLDPAFADVSNIGRDGRVLARDDRRRMSSLGNRLWHSDASFRVIPARYSLLSGRVVVTEGGNTEFADMRQAYDALDQETKDLCEALICEHSQMFSRAKHGFTEFAPEERERFKPVLQRLVRVHPSTGRKSLYLSSHAGRIVGWPEPEAKAFLMDLTEMATQREFTYAHKWRVGDLVIWDNRSTMHRARPFPHDQPRDVRRTTLMGDAPTVEQQAA